ncbi:hypothetical protein [Coleofasciculus sp. E1-EBD-02]|uniref:hypothetical protein n=1 Tax=Coleofasciculus sp. E1-EBD-02 TaxID=3068481 RepID=UPI003301DE11
MTNDKGLLLSSYVTFLIEQFQIGSVFPIQRFRPSGIQHASPRAISFPDRLNPIQD